MQTAANGRNPPLVPNAALANPETLAVAAKGSKVRIADLDGPQIKSLLWQEMLCCRRVSALMLTFNANAYRRGIVTLTRRSIQRRVIVVE